MTKGALTCFASMIIFALAGCATPRERAFADLTAEATPLCVVLDNAKSYAGKRVLIRGYVTLGPHSRDFWDDGCERGYVPVNLGPETAKGRYLRSLLDASINPFGDWDALDNDRDEGARALSIFAFDPTGAEHVMHSWGPQRVPVVYSGTFIDHSPTLVCHGFCSEFTLEEAELLAVRP